MYLLRSIGLHAGVLHKILHQREESTFSWIAPGCPGVSANRYFSISKHFVMLARALYHGHDTSVEYTDMCEREASATTTVEIRLR